MVEVYLSSHTRMLWSLNIFSNAKSNDPHGFKEELKIKYNVILAVVGKFPNNAGPMLELLAAEVPAFD